MSDFKIDYLANRPDCLHACAAWAYGRWGVQKKDGSLDRAISVFKQGMQKDMLPFTLDARHLCGHDVINCSVGTPVLRMKLALRLRH